MNNQQILATAIEKAVANGWKPDDLPDMTTFKLKRPTAHEHAVWPWVLVRMFNDDGQEVEVNIEHVLFDHDFAKALWGDSTSDGGPIVVNLYTALIGQAWQHHLQQMVIAANPIKYLEENA